LWVVCTKEDRPFSDDPTRCIIFNIRCVDQP
jgi:hypothetical protein